MKDQRLKDAAWRARVGFDNIDTNPRDETMRRQRVVSEDISAQIDRELFGRRRSN